jgi:dTDP-4-dehydrorhamnose reductase
MSDVVIFGAGGQLGRELELTQPSVCRAVYVTRTEVDIADANQVTAYLDTAKPSTIINAAAYTAVDRAEKEPEQAEAANVAGPRNLAAWAAGSGARLIHISTDFVFDGSAGEPYKPTDEPRPLGVYGKTKLEGERAVLDAGAGHIVLRTGWVYSRHGSNFVRTMLRLMQEREQLSVVEDQIGTPTWARELASVCWALRDNTACSGIYHWSDSGACSWFDFACAIQEEALTLGLIDKRASVLPIPAREYPTPATRPSYSVLDKTDTRAALGYSGRPWRHALRDMLVDMKHTIEDQNT